MKKVFFKLRKNSKPNNGNFEEAGHKTYLKD